MTLIDIVDCESDNQSDCEDIDKSPVRMKIRIRGKRDKTENGK